MIRRARRDDGSMSVEFVIVAPMLMLILALIYAYGRVAQVNGTMDAGVRDAARSATQTRSADQAATTAERVVREALGAFSPTCLDTLQVDTGAVFQPGFPVTVTATCTYPLNDLGLPGAPGTMRVSSTFTSPLDPNRSIRNEP